MYLSGIVHYVLHYNYAVITFIMCCYADVTCSYYTYHAVVIDTHYMEKNCARNVVLLAYTRLTMHKILKNKLLHVYNKAR